MKYFLKFLGFIGRMTGKGTLALLASVLGWSLLGLLFFRYPALLDQFQDFCGDISALGARRLGDLLGWGTQTKIIIKAFNLGNMVMINFLLFLPVVMFWLIGEIYRLMTTPKKYKHVNM